MKHAYRNFGLRIGLAIITGLVVTALGMTAASTAFAGAAGKQAVVAGKGMACQACAHRLQKVLAALPEAKAARVNLEKGEAVIDFTGGAKVADEQTRKTVRGAGFVPERIEWRHQDVSDGERESQPKTRTH